MKIAITHTGNPEKHQYYLDWLKADEAIEVVALSVDNNNLDEINNCDALVLSGGIDVHPELYGIKRGLPGSAGKIQREKGCI